MRKSTSFKSWTRIFIILVSVIFIHQVFAGTEEFTVNGLKVILKKNPANQVIAAHLYVRGGVFNLTPETAGIEPFLYDVMLTGTKNYPKEILNSELARMGTVIGGSPGRDYSAFTLRCIKPHFDKSWNIFADIVVNPALDPKELELSREKILTGIRQRKDNPDSHLAMIGENLFYQGHPYSLDPEGTEDAVRKITGNQIWNFLKKNLNTSKLLLVVVGDIDKADLEKKVAATFGKLPGGSYQPKYPEMVQPSGAKVETQSEELPTNYIQGYFSAPSIRDADYYAMRMAMSVLQQRIFEEVRTKRNLSYAPSAFYNNLFSNYANLYVTAVQPDTTIRVMLAEVKRLQTEPISAKELQDKINVFLTSYYMQNETNATQASFLARFELAGLGWKESEKFVELLKKVTSEQVRQVVQKYIRNIQFVVIGDPKKIDTKLFTSL